MHKRPQQVSIQVRLQRILLVKGCCQTQCFREVNSFGTVGETCDYGCRGVDVEDAEPVCKIGKCLTEKLFPAVTVGGKNENCVVPNVTVACLVEAVGVVGKGFSRNLLCLFATGTISSKNSHTRSPKYLSGQGLTIVSILRKDHCDTFEYLEMYSSADTVVGYWFRSRERLTSYGITVIPDRVVVPQKT